MSSDEMQSELVEIKLGLFEDFKINTISESNEEHIQPVFDLYELVETFEAMNGYTLKGSVM